MIASRRFVFVVLAALAVLAACAADPGPTPRLIAKSVTTGGYHSCAQMSDETVRCWGENDHGQVGTGAVGPFSVPVATQVTNLAGAVDVDAGLLFTCAALAGGTATCWGADEEGQLGDGVIGSPAIASSPQPVIGLTGVTAVAAGEHHACAVVTDGAVACWGKDTSGELGDGTVGSPASRATPQLVPGIIDAIDVTTGANFTCVLIAGGSVKCWGNDNGGTLGDGSAGSPSNRPTPAPVVDLADASSISAGANFACAGRTTGQVSCWGWDSSGQLGDGTANASAQSTPGTATGISTATAVAAGHFHACATLSDGQIRCWGRDLFGELGDGTVGPNDINPAATTVTGIADGTAVSGGATHTCALRSTGLVACWGSDNAGQLGDGTPATPTENPTAVTTLGI